jgi:hypothetical protein
MIPKAYSALRIEEIVPSTDSSGSSDQSQPTPSSVLAGCINKGGSMEWTTWGVLHDIKQGDINVRHCCSPNLRTFVEARPHCSKLVAYILS